MIDPVVVRRGGSPLPAGLRQDVRTAIEIAWDAVKLLHFGTAVETWGTGHATWLHDALLATYPLDVRQVSLRVFEQNGRARRFYERLGWTPTGRESRSAFAPHPVLVEYVLDRRRRS